MTVQPKFSIIVPSWNHCDDLLRPCCESIIKYTDFSETEVIVVLNGCTDNSREYVESLGAPFRLIWIDEQNGYTKSVNAGIRVARGEFLIPFNNDNILLEQPRHAWINALYEPFSDPKVGITGPVTNYCPAAQRDFLLFFCVMIRREALNQIGGQLDEIYSPGAGEDTAACCELQKAGWKMVDVGGPTQLANKNDPTLPAHQQNIWVNSYPIYHAAGASFGSPEMFDHYQTVIARNSEILRKRYSVNIERARWIEGWMAESELTWLGQQARTASIFIELGSWQGRSTRAIADNLPVGSILYACDTWNGSSGEPDAHKTAKEREGDGAFMKFYDNLYDHIMLGRVIPLRMESGNAAEFLAKKGVKASHCFIDADHSYEGVKRDIQLWQPLVKDGGILCGHDYNLPEQSWDWVGVRDCVDEMFPHAQQAPNTSIWHVKNKTLTPWEVLQTYAPVSEPQKGYEGFFSA